MTTAKKRAKKPQIKKDASYKIWKDIYKLSNKTGRKLLIEVAKAVRDSRNK